MLLLLQQFQWKNSLCFNNAVISLVFKPLKQENSQCLLSRLGSKSRKSFIHIASFLVSSNEMKTQEYDCYYSSCFFGSFLLMLQKHFANKLDGPIVAFIRIEKGKHSNFSQSRSLGKLVLHCSRFFCCFNRRKTFTLALSSLLSCDFHQQRMQFIKYFLSLSNKWLLRVNFPFFLLTLSHS